MIYRYKNFLRSCLLVVLPFTYSMVMVSIDSHLFYLVTYAIMILFLGFLFLRELKVLLWDYFRYYMFNLEKEAKFDKRIDRPRILIYLVFGAFSLFCFYQQIYFGLGSSLRDKVILGGHHLFFTAFWISTLVLLYTWSSGFVQSFIPEIQKGLLKSKDEKFHLHWEDSEYHRIYENLYDFNFITDSSDQNRKLFINTLSKGEIPEEPLIKLEMDNIQTRLFYDLLSEKSKGFTLKTFIGIFKNNNGVIKYNSIKASSSRNYTGAKRKKEILNCFKFQNVNLLDKKVDLG